MRQTQQAAVDGDVVGDTQIGQEPPGLEHEADSRGPQPCQLPVTTASPQDSDVFLYPIQREAKTTGGQRSHQEPQQLQGGALAAAALPGERDDLPGAQSETGDLDPKCLVAAPAGVIQIGTVKHVQSRLQKNSSGDLPGCVQQYGRGGSGP